MRRGWARAARQALDPATHRSARACSRTQSSPKSWGVADKAHYTPAPLIFTPFGLQCTFTSSLITFVPIRLSFCTRPARGDGATARRLLGHMIVHHLAKHRPLCYPPAHDPPTTLTGGTSASASTHSRALSPFARARRCQHSPCRRVSCLCDRPRHLPPRFASLAWRPAPLPAPVSASSCARPVGRRARRAACVPARAAARGTRSSSRSTFASPRARWRVRVVIVGRVLEPRVRDDE